MRDRKILSERKKDDIHVHIHPTKQIQKADTERRNIHKLTQYFVRYFC